MNKKLTMIFVVICFILCATFSAYAGTNPPTYSIDEIADLENGNWLTAKPTLKAGSTYNLHITASGIYNGPWNVNDAKEDEAVLASTHLGMFIDWTGEKQLESDWDDPDFTALFVDNDTTSPWNVFHDVTYNFEYTLLVPDVVTDGDTLAFFGLRSGGTPVASDFYIGSMAKEFPVVTLESTPVPAPASAMLLCIGLFGLAGLSKKRKKS